LRSEVHSFETDIEHIRCTRGDWVKVQSPAILWGIGPGARIKSVTMSGANATHVITDEYYLMEAGKNYAVGFRNSDGTIVEKDITGVGSDTTTNDFIFTTPFSVNVPQVGALLAFGQRTFVTSDLIVTEISWQQDGGATIRGVEYAPAVYTADSGDIPAFDPRLSTPGENKTGSYIGKVPVDEKQDIQVLNAISQNNVVASLSLTAKYPDLFKATVSPAIYFAEDDNGFCFYGDTSTEIIRQKEINRVGVGTGITTNKSGAMALNGKNGLVYVNFTQDSKLYYIAPNATGNGSAITTIAGWCPTCNNDKLYYINTTQSNKIYKTTASAGAGAGTEVAAFPVVWIEYCAATDEIFYLTPDGSIYRKSPNDTGVGTSVYTGAAAVMFSVSVSGD